MVLRVHDVQFLAHHGRIQRALDLAQLFVASRAVANADVLYALGNVLVGRVLGDAAHLLAALGFGALLSLHVGGAELLGSRVLGVYNRAWFAEKVIQVSPAYHAGSWLRARRRCSAGCVECAMGGNVPGPRRAGAAATLC